MVNEILEFIEENDVKFVRLGFTDIFGTQKNISVNPSEISNSYENGIAINPKGVLGFEDETDKEIYLVPNVSTMSVLPWRPTHGRVIRFFCDVLDSDKKPFSLDARYKLKNIEKELSDYGLTVSLATECEFYLFKTLDDGTPTKTPYDMGGAYDINPLDKGENVRREICLSLEEMGISYKSSHHEEGKGQNEILFSESAASLAADNFITYKSVVKAISARNGLYATFMPKPLKNDFGSGHTIIIRLAEKERCSAFFAGIINSLSELTAFLNPVINSYERFGSDVPEKVAFSDTLSCSVKVDLNSGTLTLYTPDGALNPYLAFATLLKAGLIGVQTSANLADSKLNCSSFPESLSIALDLAEKSKVALAALGEKILYKYVDKKREEIKNFMNSSNMEEFANENYFKKL